MPLLIFSQGDIMDTNSIMLMLMDKLPSNDPIGTKTLQEKLDKLSDAKRDDFVRNLPFLKLKSPALVFWVGSFLFGHLGVGRFMIGDTLLGGIRLALSVLYCFCGIVGNINGSGFFATIVVITLIAIWVWWVVDLFITGKKLRKKNLEKILQAIS